MKFIDHFASEPENTNIEVSEDMIPLIIHPVTDESFMDNGNIYYLILE